MATPAELGFRMPAEWEPQEAVWLTWPHPEPLAQIFPDLRFGHGRIPVRIEQATAGGEEGSRAIHVDRSALENDRADQMTQTELPRDGFRHPAIELPTRQLPSP